MPSTEGEGIEGIVARKNRLSRAPKRPDRLAIVQGCPRKLVLQQARDSVLQGVDVQQPDEVRGGRAAVQKEAREERQGKEDDRQNRQANIEVPKDGRHQDPDCLHNKARACTLPLREQRMHIRAATR